MAYTGNIVYLNRRQLKSDPNGSISYQGMSWSQYGHTESNMDIYGSPNTSGAYRDLSGNGLYFPAVATTSCINICYQYYITEKSPFSYYDCSGITERSDSEEIGYEFCASEVIYGGYTCIGFCGGLTNSTFIDYNYTNNADLDSFIIKDTTLGIELINKSQIPSISGRVNIINNHVIEVAVGQTGMSGSTDLTISNDSLILINHIGYTHSQTFSFVVDANTTYGITASVY
jgi:hypothetical protein